MLSNPTEQVQIFAGQNMTETINLSLGKSHAIEATRCKNPLTAIEELIWNSLDADATNVTVELDFNDAGGLEKIRVEDDGHGIAHSIWKDCFGQLGDSPKLNAKKTPSGRRLHGRGGKGRLKAFGLGTHVSWSSAFRVGKSKIMAYDVTGTKTSIRRFTAGDAKSKARLKRTGVTVEIIGINERFPRVENTEQAVETLSRRFCMYLTQYPNISITYDGQQLEPGANKSLEKVYSFQAEIGDGRTVDAELTIVEWKRGSDRTIYLCDSDGFSRDERKPKSKAKKNFSAYLKSDYVDELEQDSMFQAGELHEGLRSLLSAGESTIARHFLARESDENMELIQSWKEDHLYPYDHAPTSPIEDVEQKVFNVCAVNVNTFISDFDSSSKTNKKLTFRLLREALASDPTNVGRILREVVSLPVERQEDLANLLERAKLSAIINAANQVVDRIRFLDSIDEMLFGKLKKSLNEPRQLHRVLAKEMWLFGEQYHLGADEKAFANVLRAHIKILGRDDLVNDVKLINGKDGRFDLMLYTKIPTTQDSVQHLVVELKRPGIPIGQKEISQIETYAFSVAANERFDKLSTDWKFLLIGNKLDDFAKQKCEVQDRAYGHIHAGNPNIYVMTWSTLLAEARWRYEFFKTELALEMSDDDSLDYLRENHGDLFADDWSVPTKTKKKKKPRNKS